VNGATHFYQYDGTGNLLSDGLRHYTYTTARRLASISKGPGAGSVQYFYGVEGQKRLRVSDANGARTFTYFIGDVEIEFGGNNRPDSEKRSSRKHVEGIALVIEYASGYVRTLYKHHDHQGSLVALSNENGYVDSRQGFDAWGGRRSIDADGADRWLQLTSQAPTSWASVFALMTVRTDRGYTGHEHIEAMGVVHMNGRIYDPFIARFLQSDPFIEDSATLNRYTYVHNNPLGWVDPSGFTARRPNNTRDPGSYYVRQFFSIVIGFISMAYAGSAEGFKAVAAGATGAAVATYVSTGSLDQAFVRGATAFAFYGVGLHVPDSFKPLAHGVVGGAAAAASGGDFASGFMSSSFTKLVSPEIAGLPSGEFEQMVVAGIVGGIASEIAGGKFANGAVTAAMAYAFNQALSEELARGLKVKSTLEQIEDLSREDLEVLFERRFTDDDALIFKGHLQAQIRADFFSDTSSLREAAMNIVEAEYKSAGFGPARSLSKGAIVSAISRRLNVPESYIKKTLRAERVISEVNSIDPTLKGVVEGIRQGNQEVLRVWNDY